MAEKKYVCDGAKILCKLCSNPIGNIIVTSNTIKLQDNLYSTEADKQKNNLLFKGTCSKSPNGSAACTSVIAPVKWKNTADAKIQNNKALLDNSTIQCAYGGVDISILDHAQRSIPIVLMPLQSPTISPDEEPQITNITWLNVYGEPIDKIESNSIIWVKTETINIPAGSKVQCKMTDSQKKDILGQGSELDFFTNINEAGIGYSFVNLQDKKTQKYPKIKKGFWVDNPNDKVHLTKAYIGDVVYIYLEIENSLPTDELEIEVLEERDFWIDRDVRVVKTKADKNYIKFEIRKSDFSDWDLDGNEFYFEARLKRNGKQVSYFETKEADFLNIEVPKHKVKFIFNGSKFYIVDEYENILHEFIARSGNLDYMNDPKHTDKKSKKVKIPEVGIMVPKGGPIPAGKYYLSIEDYYNDKKKRKVDGYVANRYGGGWGEWAKNIFSYPETDTKGRDEFFLHEDGNEDDFAENPATLGSAGCIALGKKTGGIKTVVEVVEDIYNNYTQYATIDVIVDYNYKKESTYYKVNTDKLKLRETPDNSNKENIITSLSKGTKLRGLKEFKYWWVKVEYCDKEGVCKKGWSHAGYLD